MKVRLPIFLLLVAAGLVFCAEAAAQTAMFSATITRRDDRGQLDPKTVNYQDCILDDKLGLTLTNVSGLTSGQFDLYASQNGADCSSSTVRSTTTDCWHVGAFPLNASGSSEALTASIRTQDIVWRTDLKSPGTKADCEGMTGQLQAITLQLIPQTDASVGKVVASLQLKVDTLRPSPPTELSALGGDKALILKWTVSSSTDVLNYRMYCERAGTDTDTDTNADAGSDTTDCAAKHLTADADPADGSLDDYKRGGDLGAMATTGTADGLGENGALFACAVSAIDKNLNVGKLSELVCGTPVPTSGYYQLYREAGGNAGGGYCSFGRAPGRSSIAVGLPLAALGLSLRRMRRARRPLREQAGRGAR